MDAFANGVLVVIGLFSIAGGVFEWHWFMTNRKALLVVRLLGRSVARAFYVLLGLAFVGAGLAASFLRSP